MSDELISLLELREAFKKVGAYGSQYKATGQELEMAERKIFRAMGAKWKTKAEIEKELRLCGSPNRIPLKLASIMVAHKVIENYSIRSKEYVSRQVRGWHQIMSERAQP